jgi:hypothetical protein
MLTDVPNSSDCDDGGFDSSARISMRGWSRMTTSDQRSSKTQSDISCFIVEVGELGKTGLLWCFKDLSLETSVSSLEG